MKNASGDGFTAGAIRDELERIAASQGFSGADRRTRLLRFLVEQHLAGRADSLKESVLAIEVFDRAADYDPKLDSIVRVEMGRLRSRLIEYYSHVGKDDPVRIEIPKGSYQPVFAFNRDVQVSTPPMKPRWLVPAMIVAILAAGVAGFTVWRYRTSAQPVAISVAVLPFLNLSGEPDKQYLADSITDELTEILAESSHLRVVARTSAFQYKGKSIDIREIGRALNAGAIVEGSISRHNDKFRVLVQLIRSSDGYHQWSKTYEAGDAELPQVETEIADSAAAALLPNQVLAARTRPVISPNPEAHDLYMRAIYQLQLHTADSLRDSLRLSREAVAMDPQYVRAYFAIARAANSLGAIAVIPGRQAVRIGRDAIAKALAIDPQYSDARAYSAYFTYVEDWNWLEAEKEFELALKAEGSHGQAHSLYGWSLMTRKRFGEARSHLELAEDLDPQSPGSRQNMVNALVFARNFSAAHREIEGIFKLYPKSLVGIRDVGWVAILEKDCAAARSAAQTAAEWYPGQSDKTGSPAMKAACGENDAARRQLEQMAKESEKEFVSPYSMAQGYALLHDADRALEYLDKSAEARESVLLYSGIDQLLDPIRQDSRFRALEKRLGLVF